MLRYHYKTMKYTTILQVLLLIGVLASCQPQDEFSTGDDRTLTFSIALEGEENIQTRAYGGDLKLNEVGFGIAGYLTVGDFTADPATAVPNMLSSSKTMDGTPLSDVPWIKLPNASTKFTIKLPTKGGISGTEDGEKVSYFAWSGIKEANGYGLVAATTPGTAGYPFVDVKLRRPDGTQGDIVAAHALNFPNDYVVTAVDLDFHHLFSKFTFSVKNNTDAKVTITGTKLKFAKERIYAAARYTFNCSDSIGSFARYADYYTDDAFAPKDWTTPEVTNSIVKLGDMLLLPQKTVDGFLTLELTYTLASGTTSNSITRTIPLKALNMRPGKNYLYTLNIHAEQVEVINVTVGKWNEAPTGSLPLVPGPCGDDILILEGTDAPYPYDGKWYWLDRSGYNNHCEIYTPVSGQNTITHDPAKKAYVFNRTNSTVNNYIKIPNLDAFTNTLTIEMIARTTWAPTSTAPTVLSFLGTGSLTRSALIHMFHNKQLYFDYGGTNPNNTHLYERTLIPFAFDATQRENKAFYVFRRDASIKSFVRNNGLHYYQKPIESGFNNQAIPFTYGSLGFQWGGEIHYLKISKKKKTANDIQSDYQDLKQPSNYDIADDTDNYYLPPVTSGLILCLDARTGITENSKWRDISTSKNEAGIQINGSGENIFRHEAAAGGVQYIRLKNHLLRLKNGLGQHSNYTLQIVGWATQGTANTLISFQDSPSGPQNQVRRIHVHYPRNASVYFNSPYNSTNTLTVAGAPYSKSNYTFIKSTGNYMEIRKNVTQIGYTTNANVTIGQLNYCYIGGHNATDSDIQAFDGYICTIRFYNRILSSTELQQLYNHDVTAFGPF